MKRLGTASEATEIDATRRRRVLVVDDNAAQRKALMAQLARAALDVVGLANGAEALASARQEPPDAIVSDVLVPDLDGFALCREVRRDPQLRRVPVLLCCAGHYDAPFAGRLAVDVGADAFLSRVPGDVSPIIDALLRSLERTPR